MAEADPFRDIPESLSFGASAAVAVSPLLNLAPTTATGPTLRQSRPILPLGTSRLGGRATLSLSPDRRSVEVSVHLDDGAPSDVRLRRIGSHHLRGGGRSYEQDLLIVEIVAGLGSFDQSSSKACFPLDERGSFLPFERVSDLRALEIDLSELVAASIDGLRVEPAPAARPSGRSHRGYFEERLLMEMKAAERSASVAATCRHLELANLYARRLGSSEIASLH